MNPSERAADDAYEAENDPNGVLPGGSVKDRSYRFYRENGQGDEANVNPVVPDREGQRELAEQPPRNTDADLAHDENEAIDRSNIVQGRTRHVKPQGPGYDEGPDENDLPREVRDGTNGRSDMPRTEARRPDIGVHRQVIGGAV